MSFGNAGDSDGLGSTYIFNQLDNYPWDEDHEFQGGLRAILGSVQDPAQVEHLTQRAKCYYFARKAGTHVDFDGYKAWAERGRSAAPSQLQENDATAITDKVDDKAEEASGVGGMADAPKPASFAEICDMIAEGKPIPGIKDIPDTIMEGQASESQAQKRQKPWEKDTAGGSQNNGKLSWMT